MTCSRPTPRCPVPFREVAIRFGKPLDVTRYRDRADDRLLLRQITDELMYEIRNLSGQDYVDEYATKRHESIPSEPAVVGPKPDRESFVAVARATAESVGEIDPGEQRSSEDVLHQRPLVDLLRI